MISHLHGKLVKKQAPILVIDVNGVGYELQAPMSTFYALPAEGETVNIQTHLVVREDGHYLFGFHSSKERDLFRQLIKANGIGPKTALGILSTMDAQSFVHCIQNDDINTLVRIPGIGKKSAERLLLDLKDNLKAWSDQTGEIVDQAQHKHSAVDDAISALVALGYKPQEAKKVVNGLDHQGLSNEMLIKQALQKMMS